MKRSVIETLLGAAVLLVAMIFLVFSYKTANVSTGTGYDLVADFSGIGGLKAGDDVQISGVKIGTVKAVNLNPETFLARVTMTVDNSVKLPDDTAALISSESLLGGRYLALEPGASEEMMKAGSRVPYTQSPQNLEQLLGQFIFSMQGDKKGGQSKTASSDVP
jgi:phospholipid/cholesterol/gamma-HCH transport system substrate-binding protein